jgi:hypothetical protein
MRDCTVWPQELSEALFSDQRLRWASINKAVLPINELLTAKCSLCTLPCLGCLVVDHHFDYRIRKVGPNCCEHLEQ